MQIVSAQGCWRTCTAFIAALILIDMGYTNVEGYIAKMLRIYIICAIVVYKDAESFCAENGFRQVRIDQLDYPCV